MYITYTHIPPHTHFWSRYFPSIFPHTKMRTIKVFLLSRNFNPEDTVDKGKLNPPITLKQGKL